MKGNKRLLKEVLNDKLHAARKTVTHLPDRSTLDKLFQDNRDPLFVLDRKRKVQQYLTYDQYQNHGSLASIKGSEGGKAPSDLVPFSDLCALDEETPAGEVDPLALTALNAIVDKGGKITGWIEKGHLTEALLAAAREELDILRAVNESLPFGITCYDGKGHLQYSNSRAAETVPSSSGRQTTHREPFILNGKINGEVRVILQEELMEETLKGTDFYQDILMDMKVIFDNSWDVIYVSDSKGKTLRVSKACEFLWGLKIDNLVGKSVYDLEKEGVFRPSITRMVLESGQRVTALQKTVTGRTLLVVGNPIKDERGKIVRVINTSRDITEQSQLQLELDRIREFNDRYKQELQRMQEGEPKNLVYRSKEMAFVVDVAQKAARADSTVLISGETGAGKEVIAAAIHNWSSRKSSSFISINCASIPEDLLESELFGYQSGAFTGAGQKGKVGLVELSHEGTLFLDEIGELSINLQAKLLRVIEEKEVLRLGGTETIPVDMRVIASTNRNLSEEVQNKRFREDLYYRLSVIPIIIPPLRQRKDDIALLLYHFLKKYNIQHMKNITFAKKTVDFLTFYPWPGNVRELQNLVERLVVTSEKDLIEINDLPLTVKKAEAKDSIIEIGRIIPLAEATEILERKIFTLSLLEYSSTTEIAAALGVNQSTVSRKLNKLGLKPKKG